MGSSANRKAIASLERFQRALEATDEVQEEVSKQISREFLRRIRQQFITETDPYGKRWEPKQTPDGRKVLTGKTKRLSRYRIKRVSKQGSLITPTVGYAKYQQPRRQIVPEGRLPDAWRKAASRLTKRILRKRLG